MTRRMLAAIAAVGLTIFTAQALAQAVIAIPT